MPTKRQLDPELITVFMPEDGQSFKGINNFVGPSRWVIDDLQFDDIQNFFIEDQTLLQTPGNGATIATLPAPAIWISAQPLNQATYIFALCNNGALYQVALGGTITTIKAPGTISANTDIANWQGTNILFTDLNVSTVYNWNGSTITAVFTSQPEQWITVFAGRLWMANQSTIVFTASGTFNSLGGDSGSFIVTDTDCPPPIRAIYPYGGSLYVFGYNWVRVYGGLYDSGTPPVLQFTSSTLTDEAGLFTKWSILPFGYTINYASLYGVWNLLGSQPVFISDAVGQFFNAAVVANSSYSAAYGPILGKPCIMWNLFYSTDNTYRTLCLEYNAGQFGNWFTIQQGNTNFITYGVDQTNGQQKVWGTDTAGHVYQMFTDTVGTITSMCATKLWSFGTRMRFKSFIRAGVEVVVSGASIINLTATDENLNTYTPQLQSLSPTNVFMWNNGGNVFQWDNGGAFTWTTQGTQFDWMEFQLGMTTRKLGYNLSIQASGASVHCFSCEYYELPADWGA